MTHPADALVTDEQIRELWDERDFLLAALYELTGGKPFKSPAMTQLTLGDRLSLVAHQGPSGDYAVMVDFPTAENVAPGASLTAGTGFPTPGSTYSLGGDRRFLVTGYGRDWRGEYVVAEPVGHVASQTVEDARPFRMPLTQWTEIAVLDKAAI
jgi:hypothetical protein